MRVSNLKRGMLVRAVRNLDPQGANARKGKLGVVFERENAYRDGCGPMVRWIPRGMCNVYQGDVEVITAANAPRPVPVGPKPCPPPPPPPRR